MAAKNALIGGFGTIRHDFGVTLAASLIFPKTGALVGITAPFAFEARITEAAFVDVNLPSLINGTRLQG